MTALKHNFSKTAEVVLYQQSEKALTEFRNCSADFRAILHFNTLRFPSQVDILMYFPKNVKADFSLKGKAEEWGSPGAAWPLPTVETALLLSNDPARLWLHSFLSGYKQILYPKQGELIQLSSFLQ